MSFAKKYYPSKGSAFEKGKPMWKVAVNAAEQEFSVQHLLRDGE